MSTLTVRRLATECRAPRALGHIAGTADAVARGRLRDDLGARIGPSLDRDGEIVRIRRLPVRVAMPAAAFGETVLAEAWTSAFVRSLFQALACPSGSVAPFAVARYASRAAQLAALARHALAGAAAQRWEYAEFRDSGALDDPPRVFALCANADELRELLALLATDGEANDALSALFSRMDDAALESLFAALASQALPRTLNIEDVVSVIALIAQLGSASHRIMSTDETTLRRLALRLYASTLVGHTAARSPQALLEALLAAIVLAEAPAVIARRGESIESIAGRRLPPAVVALLESLRGGGVPEALHTAVATFAATMNIEATAMAPEAAAAPWIASPNAAIFLLAPLVPRRRFECDEREFQLLLIAAARAAIRMAREVDDDDPALPLFGGCTGTLDRAALRDFERGHASECAALAEELVGGLRARIRGFRQAPLPSIVRQFVAKPGRIRVEPRRVSVVLDRSPFHVALHLSGADDGAASLEWLGGRALEIALEGL